MKEDRDNRSHGEDYPGGGEADSPEEQYGTPSAEPDRPEHDGTKPEPPSRSGAA